MRKFSLTLCSLLALGPLTSAGGTEDFPAPSQGEIRFSVDIARFRFREGKTYLEVYYEVPAEQLTYRKADGHLEATFKTRLRVTGPRGQRVDEEWQRVSNVPSLEVARNRDLSALDQYELYPLREGEYDLSLEILDLSSEKKGSLSRRIVIEPWDDELSLSDLQFATAVEPDTSGGTFTKSGLRIIPNPTHEFGSRRMLLYSYSEIYNLKGSKYNVTYSIHDHRGTVVKTLPQRGYPVSDESAVEIGAINVIGLPPGDYRLKVEVEDGRGRADSESTFRVAELLLPKPKLVMSEQAREHYGLIKYLATQDELRFYESLSDSAQKQYLVDFWQRRDPTPITPQNEALEEFARRVIRADKDWHSQFAAGRDTDRGRLYIKYGQPDEIERHPAELTYKPYESWLYYAKGGRQFVFVDLSGYGNYELVYSSDELEIGDPQWYKYVDPSIIQVKRR